MTWVVNEGDSLLAVKAINEEINSPSQIRTLVEDIKSWVRLLRISSLCIIVGRLIH